ncbi:MAG: hypothetical protein DWQ44_04885 [Bacteroidetes bacterium]|nr:MAG: hypothetical protein DWQ33_10905 [Bacteroidota bacterium]REK00599.1 MAG: hypothetical protein DWQ39_10580 [Bacteroidota bacterium]REK35279.1 MAG: hypothetical protein DWQ44_04885 [Bacteroidota bacterium]REK48355.1 MAG: hypothetical protein DWQ48_11085 [Bacteroidota bacterium]
MKLQFSNSNWYHYSIYSLKLIASLTLVILLGAQNATYAYGAISYYSRISGGWNSSIWSTVSSSSPSCSCNPGCSTTDQIDVYHDVTISDCSPFRLTGNVKE